MSGFRWTDGEVARALGADARSADGNGGAGANLVFSAVSTDTRKIPAGSLFVALRGASFDGHDFLAQAAASGAAGAVVSHLPDGAPASLVYYRVDDTLHALGRLANHRRRALAAKVVAVAGSNGKTTTKDLLRAALSPRFRVHATDANLNNQIGVPLTLLATPDDAEIAVVEAGTNEPGEIELLGAILEPDYLVITSIGEEHLEGLGSLQGVLEEELSIVRHLRPGGVAVVAEDPPELPERAAAVIGAPRLRVAGFGEEAGVRPDGGAERIEVLPGGATRWSFRGATIELPLPGMHNVRNALLALGVAVELNVPLEAAAGAIGRMPAPKMRNEWRRVGTLHVLADCYNANPPSTRAAIELLAAVPAAGAKVAVIGTMRELGDHAESLHRSVAEAAVARLGKGIDRIVATGDFVAAFGEMEPGEDVILAEDPLEAYEALRPTLKGDETILLKGSRGVALERVIPLLERDFAAYTGGAASAPDTSHAGG